MRLVIVGANGYIGKMLSQPLKEKYEVMEVYSPKSKKGIKVDFTLLEQVQAFKKLIETTDVIINCIGLKDVNKCEEEPTLAHKVNVITVQNLLSVFSTHCKIVHLSSDFVFKGNAGNYGTQDACLPITVYGKTKLLAEKQMQESEAQGAIVRICAPFDTEAAFPAFITESILQKKVIHCFSDAYYSPISAPHFIKIIDKLVCRLQGGLKVFHLAGERISRYEFAKLYSKAFIGHARLIRPENRDKDAMLPMPDLSMSNACSLSDLDYDLPSTKIQIISLLGDARENN